jgi:hypothetical protein
MYIKKDKYAKEDKIFRGAYNYFKNESIYSEEVFDVYRDRKELSSHFVSEVHSRVSTGELLIVNVDYTISKDFVPQLVVINRSLGNEKVQETYRFNSKKNTITYIFEGSDETVEKEIATAPKFHIATPTACTSMLFLRSKKYDTTSKNLYTVFSAYNQWRFNEEPKAKTIGIQRLSLTPERLNIEGHVVQATQYKMFEDHESLNENEPVLAPSLNVWLSQHMTIPYIIHSDDGNKVVIKYLNNLSKDE